ncbi:MAG: helix-turn-helix domain-containing protein [Mycobacterium sp.]
MSRELEPRTAGSQRLGRAIRGLRRDRGLTLTQLSETSGLSVPFLSQVENNRANPSLQSLASIAHALGCSMIDIITSAQADCVIDVSRAGAVDVDRCLSRPGAQVQVDELTRETGAGEGWQSRVHDVVLYVVRGEVSIDVVAPDAEATHVLGAGDRMLCGGGVAYRWEAVRPSVVVAVRVDNNAVFSLKRKR